MKRFIPIQYVLIVSFLYLVLLPLGLYLIGSLATLVFYAESIPYGSLLAGVVLGAYFNKVHFSHKDVWSITIGFRALTYIGGSKKELNGQGKSGFKGHELQWMLPLSSIQDVIFKDKGEMLEGWYAFKDDKKIIVMLDQNTYKIMIVTAYSRGQIEKIMSLLKSRITSQS